MKFSIEKNKFQIEVSVLQSLLEKKERGSTISNILIKSKGKDVITLTATDMDNTLVLQAEAKVSQEGEICINGGKLADILKVVEGEEFYLEKLPNFSAKAKCGTWKGTILGIDSGMFPATPVFQNPGHQLPAGILHRMILKASYATSTQASRYALAGVKIELNQNRARLVSTSGYKLVYIEYTDDDLSFASKLDILIPSKTIKELNKLASAGGDVLFGSDKNHLYFEANGRLLISRLLTGKFPDYETAIEHHKNIENKVTLNSGDFQKCVEKASLSADFNSLIIKIEFLSGRLNISGESRDAGFSEDFVEADYTGEPFKIGINYTYLQEFLSRTNSNQDVTIEFDDKRERFQFREIADNFDFKLISSPIRL